jgi:hypothetical protein
MVNYVIQLHHTTMAYHIMLSLVIPRLESIKGENIGTYFKPLVEELKKLWQSGMHVHNANNVHEKHHFMLRAIILWTIHDLPMYKAVSRLATKAYQGCPICSAHIISPKSKALQNNVYTCQHRRWLLEDHEFCRDLATFDGVQ